MPNSLIVVVCLTLVLVGFGSAASGGAADDGSMGARRLNDAAARFNELRHRFVEGAAAGAAPVFSATDESPVRFSGMRLRPSSLKTWAQADGFVAAQSARLGEYIVHEVQRLAPILDHKLQTHWYYKRLKAVNDVERALGPIEGYIDGWLAFDDYVSKYGKDPYVVYVLDPTCSYRILPGGIDGHNEEASYLNWGSADVGLPNPQILPRTFPVPASPSRSLTAFGCRGQYVPVSFAIQAGEEIADLRFEVSELKQDKEMFPPAIVDLRVVKAWWRPYMDNKAWGEYLMPTLQNELLVHDNEFVTADLDKPVNHFKETKYPNDLPELSPVTILAGHTRQFWVTIHLPEDAEAGQYRGEIKASSASGHEFELSLTVDVLPFDLEPTPYAYGFYYRTGLRDEETAKEQGVHSWRKTAEQMKKELVNMARHELNTLCTYGGRPTKTEDGWDFSKLEFILEMARQAGLTRSPFLWLGHGQSFLPNPDRAGAPKTMEEAVDNLTRFTRAVNAFCDAKGYPRPAIYGIDEVSGEKLRVLKDGYGAVTAAGGIVAQACYPSYYDDIADALSLPIICPDGKTAYVSTGLANMRRSQEHGYEAWIYNCPATDMGASPALFRRRYGLAMWRNGEGGAIPWEYSGHGSKYRPYMERPAGRLYAVTHPTWDGDPIDTIIYEAFREGIYDTRYMATLEKHLRRAKDKNAAPELVARIDAWLAGFSVNDDLQKLRRQIADFIVALSKGLV